MSTVMIMVTNVQGVSDKSLRMLFTDHHHRLLEVVD